jgi:hypothetical protein
MDSRSLEALAQHHPAWRLLRADHAPLVVSFLHRTFIAPNIRTLPQPEIAIRLDDALFHLRRELGDRAFPRSAQAYLDDWASDDHAWLRKYYPPEGDDPHFDITTATEKAIVWLESLTRRQFVGTRSRLVTVFELLRQLIESTETDASVRIAELERRRGAIDAEIARIQGGELPIIEEADAKERFLHAAQMAKALLSDLRQVEQNFRDLDRGVRERIATWDREKGALLDAIFGERDAIVDIDTHGFAMLSRLRARFPHAKSLLMDRETLIAHRALWSRETTAHAGPPAHLNETERAPYDELKEDRLGKGVRLEQERISFSWFQRALSSCNIQQKRCVREQRARPATSASDRLNGAICPPVAAAQHLYQTAVSRQIWVEPRGQQRLVLHDRAKAVHDPFLLLAHRRSLRRG